MNEAQWKAEQLKKQSERLLAVLKENPQGVYTIPSSDNESNRKRVLRIMEARHGVFELQHLRASVEWLAKRGFVDNHGKILKKA